MEMCIPNLIANDLWGFGPVNNLMECAGFNRSEEMALYVYYHDLLGGFTRGLSFIHSLVFIPLCVIGVLANGLIVGVLLRPSMRSNIFNNFLVVIAFCDGTLMATYLLFNTIDDCDHWYYSYWWIVFTKTFAVSSVFIHALSLWLTVNMAILRYMVLSQGTSSVPSRLPSSNSPRVAIVAILIAIVVAFLGSFLVIIRYEIHGGGEVLIEEVQDGKCLLVDRGWTKGDRVYQYGMKRPSWFTCFYDRLNFWLVAVVLKLIPCLLLTVFMTLLVNMLIETKKRRERLCASSTSTNTQAERTTAMLTTIVAVFLLTELPQGLTFLSIGVKPELNLVHNAFMQLFNLLSLINSSTNFLLCALMSAVFRRECVSMCSSCCPQVNHVESAPSRLLTVPSAKKGFVAVPTTCPP